MKLRPYAAATAVLAAAALDVAVIAPAHAVAPDPVTGVTISQSQQAHSWVVDASWSAATGAEAYRVAITDHADGTNTPGAYYDGTNTTATSAELVTDDLLPGHTYWVRVIARNAADEESTVVTEPFQAITLDTTAPTGTFKLDHTRDWVAGGGFFGLRHTVRALDIFDEEEGDDDVVVKVSQLTLADDTTAASEVTRQVRADANAPLRAWTGTKPASLGYSEAGVFHPQAVLTDKYGNSRVVPLGTVTIVTDPIGPRVRFVYPPVERRWKAASWRVVRGTSVDSASGNGIVLAMVLQRRGGRWYAYDFENQSWERGTSDLQKTLEDTDATPAAMLPTANRWHTPLIFGLKRGLLHIETISIDQAGNLRLGPKVHHRLR
ncbi:MAG: fibronectin type III domain-containing protein [Nocardioidaceae bacterium]|nr:fibronectin type III domain-containing protein [Nocardioidaceae bacterium]